MESGKDIEADEGGVEGQPAAPQDASASDVPWYLQVDPPRHVAHIEPPPLPEVPPDSPPVVGSLLNYVSEELGLDEIDLLDLRKLDPPPALGPNLFMLFGTARSERHLTVSAGRLVRWLKYQHRVYAYADGLLGPNERKKKLKRKAKRAKLLGTMGEDEFDDGIKTGWICVNLGNVGQGGGESTVIGEDGRVAGFGVAQAGSTIVVQIMTESRRTELDLETLWKRALRRSLGEEVSTPTENEQLEPKKKPVELHPLEQSIAASSSSRTPTRPTAQSGRDKASPFGQASFYSTTPEPRRVRVRANDELRVASLQQLSHYLTYDGVQKGRVLDLLLTRLVGLPHHNNEAPLDIRRALSGSRAEGSLVHLIEMACKNLPPSTTWGQRLTVETKARELRDGVIRDLSAIRDLVEEMRVYGIEATRRQYLQLLRCIYWSTANSAEEQAALATKVLTIMALRGHLVIANDVITTLIESALLSPRWEEDEMGPERQLVDRLHDLLSAERQSSRPPLPCMGDTYLQRLMIAYARRGLWDHVWNAWREPARHLRRRSPALYIHLLVLAARTGDPEICATAARRTIQEAASEEKPVHPVANANIRSALLACIRVVDAMAETHARSFPPDSQGAAGVMLKREFVKLVRMLGVTYEGRVL